MDVSFGEDHSLLSQKPALQKLTYFYLYCKTEYEI